MVCVDLYLKLVRENWKYRQGVVGLRTANEVHLFLFLRYYLHIIKYTYFKGTVQRVKTIACTHVTATQIKIQNISITQKVALCPPHPTPSKCSASSQPPEQPLSSVCHQGLILALLLWNHILCIILSVFFLWTCF